MPFCALSTAPSTSRRPSTYCRTGGKPPRPAEGSRSAGYSTASTANQLWLWASTSSDAPEDCQIESIPAYILGEAALSFLGLGIQEPSASWGLMLSQAQNDMKVFMLNFWWLLTPGVAIFVTVIAFNVLGDALRDIVDPRMKV